MRAIRIVLMVLGGVVVVAAGLFVFVFLATDDAADAASAMLARIAAGDARGAYDAAAPELREVQDFAAFEAAAATLGLDRFEDASWNSRAITDDRATVEGTVTLEGGRELRLRVELVEGEDGWQVTRFTAPGGDASVGGGLAPLPELEPARALVQGTLGAFADAVRRADFAAFHAGVSALWRAQITAEELQAAFQSLIDAGATLEGIEALQPELSRPPGRDDEGALVLAGYVADAGGALHFRLRYVYEHPEWRLIGIDVGSSPID